MYHKADKWLPATKEEFYRFIKERNLLIFLNRKNYKYYGNASRMAMAKSNKKEEKYFIHIDALK